MDDIDDPWADRDASNCSIARALEVVGEKWTLLILRELWYGASRFSEFEETLGCPRNLLAARLAKLVSHGLLATEDYQEPGTRTRKGYVLTPKGAELVEAVLALMHWGDRYYADAEGPPVTVRHGGCEAEVHVRLRCEAGHDVQPSELESVPGPGYRTRTSV